jgi:adenosylcobinamide kinase/adenosylcobinamide-phosphate guanylyltransferase
MSGTVVLIGGGVRSGKSAFALARARELGARRAFIATAEPFDDEMRARAQRHRLERGGDFFTIEAPRALTEALHEAAREADVVVIDCLTLWLSNLLLSGLDGTAIRLRVDALGEALQASPAHVVLVSNEVGLGIVPESKLGRVFRDLSGEAHQSLGHRAQELYFAMMGQLVRLRPGPLELVASAPFRAHAEGDVEH